MTLDLHVATYNIHKGFSQFNRRMVVHELRERLRGLGADIVFLQEVQGLHLRHAMRHDDWPDMPQHEFLAAGTWPAAAYGRNMVYDHGHHGNAILSRFPILAQHNQDVTQLRFEKRGLLHCVVDVPGLGRPLHCVCVHLSLFGHSRRRQLAALATRIETIVPSGAPLLIAGDFNDWRNRAHDLLADRLGMTEVFSGGPGNTDGSQAAGARKANGSRPPKSFPSLLPVFRLDRIYVRGFAVKASQVHHGAPWSRISDHAALSTRLAPG